MPQSEDDIKRGLLYELSWRLSGLGGTQESAARRLGVPRSDISAIHAGNAKRFTLERILRIFRRFGLEVDVGIAASSIAEPHVSRGVRGMRLRDLGLESLTDYLTTKPGLTLIGGDVDGGQRELLRAVLSEHTYRQNRVVLFARRPERGEIQVVHFRDNGDLVKWITYYEDIDIRQRERFGSTVIGIDEISECAASPWTALHFAKTARVYGMIQSPVGSDELQRAVDEFVALLGNPHIGDSWRVVHEHVDTVFVPHIGAVTPSGQRILLASVARVVSDSAVVKPEVETIVDADTHQTTLIADGQIASAASMSSAGPLLTEIQSRQFLSLVRERLGSAFQITSPRDEDKRELELQIIDRQTSAEVTVAASWSPSSKRYGIVITTEEPDGLTGDRIPETSLSMAPTDVDHICRVVANFLGRFSSV
jgi:predicted XRE-type DNA-binding protein